MEKKRGNKYNMRPRRFPCGHKIQIRLKQIARYGDGKMALQKEKGEMRNVNIKHDAIYSKEVQAGNESKVNGRLPCC